MQNKFKKILCCMLSVFMYSFVFANIHINAADTLLLLTSEQASLDVIVPLTLPIYIDSSGEIITADNTKIINSSGAPVEVVDTELTVGDGYSAVDYDSDLSKAKANTKEFGLMINSDKTTDSGTISFDKEHWNAINPSEELNINYSVKLPVQSNSLSDINIGQVTFIIDWAEDSEDEAIPETPISDYNYTSDGTGITLTKYKGTDEYPSIPAIVDGLPVVSLKYTFADNSIIKGITGEIPDTVTMMILTFGNCPNLTGDIKIKSPTLITADGLFADTVKSIKVYCNSDIMPMINEGAEGYMGLYYQNVTFVTEIGNIYLDYTYTSDGTGVTLAKYIGELSYPDMPATVDGLPVVALISCFEDNLVIKNIGKSIPSTVTLMERTFTGCTNLSGNIRFKGASILVSDNLFKNTAKPITVYCSADVKAAIGSSYPNVTFVVS